MGPQTSEDSVRRCPRCGEAAALVLPAAADPEARHVRCQACGAFDRWPARPGCVHVAIGIALLWPLACVVPGMLITVASQGLRAGDLECTLAAAALSIVGLVASLRPRVRARRWILVDAPRPEVRYPAPVPPSRRCACGGAAPCIEVHRERLRSILPIGKRYVQRCETCHVEHDVHDATGIAFAAFAASVLTAVGVLIVVYPPGSAVGAAESNRWFGIALLAIGGLAWIVPAIRIAARVKHPVVRPRTF